MHSTLKPKAWTGGRCAICDHDLADQNDWYEIRKGEGTSIQTAFHFCCACWLTTAGKSFVVYLAPRTLTRAWER